MLDELKFEVPGIASAVLIALVGLGVILTLLRWLNLWTMTNLAVNRLKKLGYGCDEDIGLFDDAQPLVPKGSNKPYRIGYLLICGHGSIPGYWKTLTEYFDQDPSVFYFAARLQGSGRTSFKEDMATNWQEWLLNFNEAFKVVEAVSERIEIVGHSNGCVLAALLMEKYHVSRAVLSAPNFANPKNVVRGRFLLYSRLFLYTVPLYPGSTDTLNPEFRESGFYYNVSVVKQLKEMLRSQALLSRPWKVEEVVITRGDQDHLVADLDRLVEISKKFIPKESVLKTHILENCAHNPCSEVPEVVEEFASIVLDKL